MSLPIAALGRSRPWWSLIRARVSLFPVADCFYTFSLVEMKTNGIPRCPRQNGLCIAHRAVCRLGSSFRNAAKREMLLLHLSPLEAGGEPMALNYFSRGDSRPIKMQH